eukprot:m.495535 g.495535  ORF g.495535 m.495535 type:complete len:104 (+) comp44721_c0_seq1:263-574(+)
MKKRLIDYAILATRAYLTRQPITHGVLRQAILTAVEIAAENADGGMVELMAPAAAQKSKRELTRKRLADLNKAEELIIGLDMAASGDKPVGQQTKRRRVQHDG